MEVNIKFNSFEELAEWIHKSEKHREELEQDNIDLTKEVRQLRSEIKALKNATARNSDESIFNTDSIPQIFKGRDSNVK